MIKVLPKDVAARIAAGEVVDRPLSIVKELVENSIDAGSKSITVEIKRGGKTYVRVTDDGSGIAEDEVLVAFKRHATSKIETDEDLKNIETLGFRGEALASIAAVSNVRMITKTEDEPVGNQVIMRGGELVENTKTGCPKGTTIVITDLFFNTPARQKFMKSDGTESSLIIDFVSQAAMAYPDIKIRLINNDSILFSTNGKGDIYTNLVTVFGASVGVNFVPVNYEEAGIAIKGYVSGLSNGRTNKKNQVFFVNGRVVSSKVISKAVTESYAMKLTGGRYPISFLFLKMNPKELDVNIHPNKKDVRFADEKAVSNAIINAISKALVSKESVPKIHELDVKNPWKFHIVKSKRDIDSDNMDSDIYSDNSGGESPLNNGKQMLFEGLGSDINSDINTDRNHDWNVYDVDMELRIKAMKENVIKTALEAGLLDEEDAKKELAKVLKTKNLKEKADNVISLLTKERRKERERSGKGISDEPDFTSETPKEEKNLNTTGERSGETENSASYGDYKETAQNFVGEDDISGEILDGTAPKDAKEAEGTESTAGAKAAEEAAETMAAEKQQKPQKPAFGHDWESLKVKGITPFDFRELKIRGVIFNTYIIATDNDAFYLIDQHAAHERIFFEKLFRQFSESEKAVQPLLMPFVINVPYEFDEEENDWMQTLKNYGFELEEFGPRTYRVSGIPYFMELSEAEDFLNSFTDNISEKTDFTDSVQLEKIMQRSCKSAVKAGDVLSEKEVEALIKDLSNCRNPFSCPHGRPTFICMTKYEIEKMFKRVL